MGEVLSQSEIDNLLKALSTGELDAEDYKNRDEKQVKIYVNEALYEDFKSKLKADKLTAKEVLETAIYRYIHGDLHINKENWK